MRIIERRPNSGIYLRNSDESSIEALVLHAESGLPFQAEEIADVVEVRRILEVQAARLACTRRTPERWSRFPGQFGGKAKMDSGFDYAASLSSLSCLA